MFMGEISYSVYILQFWMTASLAGALVSNEASPLAYLTSTVKTFGIVGLATAVAFGSYHLLEKPCRTWMRVSLGFVRPR
jgi:peptidoglycan/LPS O-acetylase OafA/YrhL